jgi:hypothetical protein
MTFDFVSASEQITQHMNKEREAAVWRLLRRFLGPECPADPFDVLQVLLGRGVEAQIIIPSGGEPPLAVIKGRDGVLDSEELPTFRQFCG